MKFVLIKKEKNRKRGFALLFSVLVSSLLLTIGLSIFSIALKELAISTATRQSIHAFYAADSGLEYARYHDLRAGDMVENFSADKTSVSSTTANLFVDVNVDSGPNFVAKLEKTITNYGTATQHINTSIVSTGWDTDSGDKVEREIEIKY